MRVQCYPSRSAIFISPSIGGEIFAANNFCTHGYSLLTDGFLDGETVERPLHGGCFNVRMGKALCESVETDLCLYETRIIDDWIEIHIEG